MSDTTRIEWTNATWNPITGCTIVSKGCQNCYAMRLAGGRLRHNRKYEGLTQPSKAGPVWNGEVRFDGAALIAPLRWRKPKRIFVCSMSDLFHEDVPNEWIDKIFAVMALAPQHTFQVLTKRPERQREYFVDPRRRVAAIRFEAIKLSQSLRGAGRYNGIGFLPFPNVWFSTSIEDQKRADERIPHLLNTPAAVRFLSCEPLLGPIDLTNIPAGRWPNDPPGPAEASYVDSLRGERWYLRQGQRFGPDRVNRIDWVIVGSESGPGARPMHPDWARSIRDQCQAGGVPFFFKQWGEWAPAEDYASEIQEDFDVRGLTEGPSLRVGRKAAGRKLDGRTWDEYPDG